MHAHTLHKGQRADKDDVARDLRADAACVIDLVRGGLKMLPELCFQERFKYRRQRTFTGLQRGKGIADDLGCGIGCVELHAIGADALNGEKIAVAQQNGVLAAEDPGAVPAAQRAMNLAQPLCQNVERTGKGEKPGTGGRAKQKKRPAVQEARVAAAGKDDGGSQRPGEQNGGIDAEERLRSVRLFQLTAEDGAVARIAAQSAVLQTGDPADAHGVLNGADGSERGEHPAAVQDQCAEKKIEQQISGSAVGCF